MLIERAEACDVTLGIEPEPANVVSDASLARHLIDEVGSERLGIVFDPANLVAGKPPAWHERLISEALDKLAPRVLCSHAKDVSESGFVAAGLGEIDYELIFRLLAEAGVSAPVMLQDAAEHDVPSARDYVLRHREPWMGLARLHGESR